jgi:CHAT domain-containing protein
LNDYDFFSNAQFVEVKMSNSQAKDVKKEWLAKIRMIESGSNLQLIDKNFSLLPFLSEIKRGVEFGRRVILSLSENFSAIPIEQIPFGQHQVSLFEHFQLSRPALHNRWLEVVNRRTINLSQDEVYVGGIPDRQNQDNRLNKAHLKMIANQFNTAPRTGKYFHSEQILRDIQGKSIVHILCHGESFQIHGETGFPVMETEDGFLIGHEISNLDLRELNLVVISSCKSGYGRNVGVSKIETMASFFLEAGAQTVIAATTLLNANNASLVFNDFYRHLLKGDSIGLCATKAFGKTQRIKYQQELFSWVVYGNLQALNFSRNEN